MALNIGLVTALSSDTPTFQPSPIMFRHTYLPTGVAWQNRLVPMDKEQCLAAKKGVSQSQVK